MKIFDKILDWIYPYEKVQQTKTLKDLDYFDTVWVLDKSKCLLKGWVYDINKKHIIVVTCTDNIFLDFRFEMKKPLNVTQLTQNGITLYLNN